MEEKEIKEVAAEAAVVDNAANNAASVEPTATAEELLKAALSTAEGSRKKQKELFSTHFGGTEDRLKVKKAAKKMLETLDAKVAVWKANLNGLLQAINQAEATEGFDSLLETAGGLTPELKAKLLAALQPNND